MKFTFVKIAEHRTFHHKPIYYDEDKEEREERLRNAKNELGVEQEQDDRTTEARVRGKMRRRIHTNIEVTRKEKRKSNLRLIIIIIALMILFYYLFNTGKEWMIKYM